MDRERTIRERFIIHNHITLDLFLLFEIAIRSSNAFFSMRKILNVMKWRMSCWRKWHQDHFSWEYNFISISCIFWNDVISENGCVSGKLLVDYHVCAISLCYFDKLGLPTNYLFYVNISEKRQIQHCHCNYHSPFQYVHLWYDKTTQGTWNVFESWGVKQGRGYFFSHQKDNPNVYYVSHFRSRGSLMEKKKQIKGRSAPLASPGSTSPKIKYMSMHEEMQFAKSSPRHRECSVSL